MRRDLSVAAIATVVLALGSASCTRSCAGRDKPEGAAQTPGREAPPTEADLRVRRDLIRSHFDERTKRRQVVATTVTKSGQTIDWIRAESQVPSGRLAVPPDVAPSPKDPGKPANPFLEVRVPLKWADLQARSELELDEKARGPKGTVPIVRFDVERYLTEEKIPPRDPRDVLQKIPPPAPASNNRYYVFWDRFGTFFGSAGRINVWDTSGPVGNETSIAQTAVTGGTPMQAIEAGKIELQSLNGNRGPYFFTYYRTNDQASGDWVGGYNTLVDGWIQYSSTVAPGMSIAAWNSQTGGNQYSLDVEVRIHQGNWWVWVAGQWAGYYPHCRGGDADPCDTGTLFAENGIRDQVSRMIWFGEVFDSSAPTATSTDMGSGAFAVGGWQQAGYFRNLTFFWAPTTYWWWDSGSASVTDGACYSGNGPFYSSDPSWRNWFFYGGPGKEGSGCK